AAASELSDKPVSAGSWKIHWSAWYSVLRDIVRVQCGGCGANRYRIWRGRWKLAVDVQTHYLVSPAGSSVHCYWLSRKYAGAGAEHSSRYRHRRLAVLCADL